MMMISIMMMIVKMDNDRDDYDGDRDDYDL